MGETGGSTTDQTASSDLTSAYAADASPWRVAPYEGALRALSARTRLSIKADSGPIEACRTESIRDRHRGPACFVHLRHRDHSNVLIEVPAGLALLLIDRSLGARSVRPMIPRPLRVVECGIFTHLVAEASRHLPSHHWRVMDVHGDRSSAACEWRSEHALMRWTAQVWIEESRFDLRVWFDPVRLPTLDPLTVVMSGATKPHVEVPCHVEVAHCWLEARALNHLTPGCGLPLWLGPRSGDATHWSGDLHLSPLADPTLLWCLRSAPSGWRLLSPLPLRVVPPWGAQKTRLSVYYQRWMLPSEALHNPDRPIDLPISPEFHPRVRVAAMDGSIGRGEIVRVDGLPVLRWEGWN